MYSPAQINKYNAAAGSIMTYMVSSVANVRDKPQNLWGWRNVEKQITKATSESVTLTDAETKSVTKALSESSTLTDDFTKQTDRTISESVTMSGDAVTENLQRGNWTHVFPSDATNAEDRDFSSWTSGTTATAGWTSGTTGASGWT